MFYSIVSNRFQIIQSAILGVDESGVSPKMDQQVDNPSSNNLKSGLSIAEVDEAIRRSGYPLQVVIADILRSHFFVEEEWGFRDNDAGSIRTLDIVAERSFCDASDPNRFRVRPTLCLLVECKQGDLPFVFFLSRQHLWNYPKLSGLASDTVQVTTDDDRSIWSFDVLSVLGFNSDPFLKAAAPCATFSKCVRAGKGLELSGSEAYNSLVLPLVAAMRDFDSRCKPPTTAYYFEARVILAVAVLDAPMIGIEMVGGERSMSFVPWVRLVRNSPPDDPLGRAANPTSEPMVLDIVHKDYFEDFLKNHVEPFMLSFRDRAQGHHEILADGKAFLSGMGAAQSFDIEHLQPITTSVPSPARSYRGWRGAIQTASILSVWARKNITLKAKRRFGRKIGG